MAWREFNANSSTDYSCSECRGPVDKYANRCRHCAEEFTGGDKEPVAALIGFIFKLAWWLVCLPFKIFGFVGRTFFN